MFWILLIITLLITKPSIDLIEGGFVIFYTIPIFGRQEKIILWKK